MHERFLYFDCISSLQNKFCSFSCFIDWLNHLSNKLNSLRPTFLCQYKYIYPNKDLSNVAMCYVSRWYVNISACECTHLNQQNFKDQLVLWCTLKRRFLCVKYRVSSFFLYITINFRRLRLRRFQVHIRNTIQSTVWHAIYCLKVISLRTASDFRKRK